MLCWNAISAPLSAPALDEIRLPRPEVALALSDWSEHLRVAGVPGGFLSRADPSVFHVLVASLGGENVFGGARV